MPKKTKIQWAIEIAGYAALVVCIAGAILAATGSYGEHDTAQTAGLWMFLVGFVLFLLKYPAAAWYRRYFQRNVDAIAAAIEGEIVLPEEAAEKRTNIRLLRRQLREKEAAERKKEREREREYALKEKRLRHAGDRQYCPTCESEMVHTVYGWQCPQCDILALDEVSKRKAAATLSEDLKLAEEEAAAEKKSRKDRKADRRAAAEALARAVREAEEEKRKKEDDVPTAPEAETEAEEAAAADPSETLPSAASEAAPPAESEAASSKLDGETTDATDETKSITND